MPQYFDMTKEKILVIGASGQIGVELTLALRKIYGNAQVVASDLREENELLKGTGPYVSLDVMNKEMLHVQVIRQGITHIYLLAAILSATGEKKRQAGNDQVILTERGTTFGYQDLVVDYRNIPIMQKHAVPVVMDCTHSLQQPNQASGVTGGNPQLIGTIAKAAIAAEADGIFIETHPRPAEAKSDGANMLPLEKLEGLLQQLVRLREAVLEP